MRNPNSRTLDPKPKTGSPNDRELWTLLDFRQQKGEGSRGRRVPRGFFRPYLPNTVELIPTLGVLSTFRLARLGPGPVLTLSARAPVTFLAMFHCFCGQQMRKQRKSTSVQNSFSAAKRRGKKGGARPNRFHSSSLFLSSLKLSDARVYQPSKRALRGTTSHFSEEVVLN